MGSIVSQWLKETPCFLAFSCVVDLNALCSAVQATASYPSKLQQGLCGHAHMYIDLYIYICIYMYIYICVYIYIESCVCHGWTFVG